MRLPNRCTSEFLAASAACDTAMSAAELYDKHQDGSCALRVQIHKKLPSNPSFDY